MDTKVTPTQSKILAECVKKAYDNGWDGSLQKTTLRPKLGREGTEPTRLAMEAKGLLEWGKSSTNSGQFYLTAAGVAAGNDFYLKRHGGTAEADAKIKRTKEQEEAQAEQDKVDHAAHLFRGLNSATRARGGTKAMSSRIKKRQWGEVRLSIDDLIALGEGIEKLR